VFEFLQDVFVSEVYAVEVADGNGGAFRESGGAGPAPRGRAAAARVGPRAVRKPSTCSSVTVRVRTPWGMTYRRAASIPAAMQSSAVAWEGTMMALASAMTRSRQRLK